MDTEKRVAALRDRLTYVRDIFGDRENDTIRMLRSKLAEFLEAEPNLAREEQWARLTQLEELFDLLERRLDAELSPMDRVRIVRHPQRFCLKDVLENVYDNYSEIGGQGEHSIDPAMLIARATFLRRVGRKVFDQPVMVIGHEKGHGEEFRNGGSAKPWGNAKALQAMKVAEIENIPVHAWVFTPGAYPLEDYPGAAQQIARNLYEMAGLRVPVVAVFSEGGSGGAEAIALADKRLMLSHGYYSVISPEGAAAIESGLRPGQRADAELVAQCAARLKITARDNAALGFVDRVIQEPPLGARPDHAEFFRRLRRELVHATNEVVSQVAGMKFVRALALRRRADEASDGREESVYMRWDLGNRAKDRLVWKRAVRFRQMSRWAYRDPRSSVRRAYASLQDMVWAGLTLFRHDFLGRRKRRVMEVMEDIAAEAHVLKRRLLQPFRGPGGDGEELAEAAPEVQEMLTCLSRPGEEACRSEALWDWVSPRSREDRTVTCPNARTHGCPDLWAPDLFDEFAGVCATCGHHFPMEYQWVLHNVLDFKSAYEFNAELEAANPLGYEGLDLKLAQARKNTRLKSSCITFETALEGLNLVVAALVGPFRGGSVGAAEGEKFIRAAERARRMHLPFLAYVHGTAGIRIQEGVAGVIQMPRCTIAVRRYIEAGGLYVVLYDTNSYAGPVASFLGCSPYQFAVRSANVGFAGPGVIAETTGMPVPPHYHSCWKALSRGHIQGIWDRRDLRKNLHRALLTMGGRNLYYR
ncbi:acetyl-CoA carboxylase carboxyl transferase subunit alpha/beta [Desulfovibrio aminophilus]|nr:acetyl-CoA carboxylase carboxyl transferase subunit alpha/beta [Desulfovibrio aminophilus]MCM0755137.1 acetyl-CoA carboxylase carboxyl transferase subunit alpha/beta [Desulfovibrio aminophilus]